MKRQIGKVACLRRFISKSIDKCVSFAYLLRGNKTFNWSEACEQPLQARKQHLSQPLALSKPVKGETLYIYLAVTDVAPGVVLVRLEDTIQKVVYYVSKRLVDAE